MKFSHLLTAVPAVLIVLGAGSALAGSTINKVGVLVCVVDKWDETEPEKGHKLVDYAGRCVNIPDDTTVMAKAAEDCKGSYEYMPDGSWKGLGTCDLITKEGDKLSQAWEEGSHLKESTFKITGGSGKFQGASGGGTYSYESLTDTLSGGRYNGKIELP
ncbi:MAG: hypothetical protein FJX44_06295 [Alphaproteobacteria bacterium]|nr:hypothetical protein [Alphaproteobacteria bacterium]